MAAKVEGAAVGAPGSKGLKADAIGFVSDTVIGVASTAPAYSLAVSLGLVAAAVGIFSPAIMIVAFIPMLCIAVAYYYLNKADPDCGTSFAWVSRALGPIPGWLSGWAIIVADIVVMASLAEVAAVYTLPCSASTRRPGGRSRSSARTCPWPPWPRSASASPSSPC